MSGAIRRDVSPFVQRLREFFLGRPLTNALRFEDGLADRTTDPPQLPDGPAHLLSANYYVNRDGRREVAPPINLTQNLLLSGDSGAPTQQKVPTPGKIFQWD